MINLIIPIISFLLLITILIKRNSKPKLTTFDSLNKVYCIKTKKQIKMKTLLLIVSMLLAINLTQAQSKPSKANVTVDASGNYKSLPSKKKPKVEKPTTKTYTDSKGKVYPVYESVNGKLFIYKISKNTNLPYIYYLKV